MDDFVPSAHTNSTLWSRWVDSFVSVGVAAPLPGVGVDRAHIVAMVGDPGPLEKGSCAIGSDG